MLTSPQLGAAIAAALEKHPEAARDRVSEAAGFAVVAAGPATSRPLKLVGLADVIGLYPTLDEARAALA